jgi:hypothetical protein
LIASQRYDIGIDLIPDQRQSPTAIMLCAVQQRPIIDISMPPVCRTYHHPQPPEIDSAIIAGQSLRNIAHQFGPSPWSILRHRKHTESELIEALRTKKTSYNPDLCRPDAEYSSCRVSSERFRRNGSRCISAEYGCSRADRDAQREDPHAIGAPAQEGEQYSLCLGLSVGLFCLLSKLNKKFVIFFLGLD